MDAVEWGALEKRALWLLAHADQAAPWEFVRGTSRRLRLWAYAPSAAWTSWILILGTSSGRRPVVREARWDRTADWQRARLRPEHLRRRGKNEPTVRFRDAEAAWDVLSPLVRRAVLTLRSRIASDPACAGEARFGIEGYGAMARLRVEWTGGGLHAGPEVIRSISTLRKALMNAMDERATGILPRTDRA